MTLDQLLSKAFNGKAENIVISKNIIMFHLDGVETRINLVSFIDQIYNDHEAQLKLASDVYSTDKMHMYQELKAKDKITQDIKEAYELKSIAYDLLLEAIKLKDEEIERLKAELLICKKRYTQKAVEGKELKKTLSIAWSKQLKEQQ